MREKVIFFLLAVLLPFKAYANDSKISDAVNIRHTMATFDNYSENNISDGAYRHKSNEYSEVTDDPNVMKALDLMVGTIGESSRASILGNNQSGKAMKIVFKDLTEISPQYKDFDALGWKVHGQLYIYINNKHKNAPAEAIGSLLSHEALHDDNFNSLNEETYAWTMESAVWLQMKKRNSNLNNLNQYPLVSRENSLGAMFRRKNYTDKDIRQEVENNPGYSDLPKRSPGFEDDN